MIYLIRHGEAAASWGSHPDPGLSELGQAQAIEAAKTLATCGIKQIISSPMARCQETAQAFANTSNMMMMVEPTVTEIPTPSDIEDRIAWLRRLMSGNWSDAPEIVENWRQNLIQTVSALPDDTAVFTHFVAINAMVGHLEGTGSVTVFKPNYCSLTKLDKQNQRLALVERGKSLETKVL